MTYIEGSMFIYTSISLEIYPWEITGWNLTKTRIKHCPAIYCKARDDTQWMCICLACARPWDPSQHYKNTQKINVIYGGEGVFTHGTKYDN